MGKDLRGKELGPGLTQRKDGLYQARYKDGAGKRRSIYGRNLKDLRKELAAAVTGNAQGRSVRAEMALDSWFGQWMAIYKVPSIRPGTAEEYRSVYERLVSPRIGGRKISSLTKSDMQGIIAAAAEKGYGSGEMSRARTIMKDMMQCAADDGLVEKNPAENLVVPGAEKGSKTALTREQQDIFFDCCRGTFYDNMFNVAINTGMRPGELFALRLDDVNLEEGFINVDKSLSYRKYIGDARTGFHIGPTKTPSGVRKVPINSECRKYLEKQLEQKKIVAGKHPKEQNDFLFTTRYNTPMTTGLYRAGILAIVTQINRTRPADDQFPAFGGHVFRHTFATRCFESGIDAKVVQMYLGHAGVQVTMDRYTHVMDDRAMREIEWIVPGKDNIVPFKRKMA